MRLSQRSNLVVDSEENSELIETSFRISKITDTLASNSDLCEMSKVCLHFFGTKSLALGELSFSHPLIPRETRSVRGKTQGAHAGCTSFPWGPVAKGLSLLLLRARAFGTDYGVLRGDGGSFAASLDYALSKPPVWFQELFGSDRRGETLGRRIIRRTNPERKRPGPVTLALNPHQLVPENIEVRWNGQTLLLEQDIRLLLQNLENVIGVTRERLEVTTPTLSGAISTESERPNYLALLEKEYFEEVRHSLQRIDIFSPRGMRLSVESLRRNPSFNKLIPRPSGFLNSLRSDLHNGALLGCCDPSMLDRELKQDEPIKIWVTAVQPANYLIMKYLRDVKGYNISLDYHFTYGVDLAHQTVAPLSREEPDICFAGVGPASYIYQHAKARYKPWTIAPTLTHAIAGHAESDDRALQTGEYHFVIENPTTASFCFDHLSREGTLKEQTLGVHHAEPEDVLSMFKGADKDFRTLIWFPFYNIYRLLYGAKVLSSLNQDAFHQVTVGFVHTRLRNTSRFTAFEIAFRDAWLTLRENPALLKTSVQQIVRDAEYAKFVSRACGLYKESVVETSSTAHL